MSYIGKNIKKIRTVKKLSQAKFAELFNLARPSVGAYEEGRSEPKIDTVIQISEHFQLSIDALLTKEITVNELYHFDIFNTEEQTVQLHPASSQLQTPYVSLKDQTAYCQQGHDKAYRDKLPSLQFPKGKSTHRIFEVPETSLLNIEKGDLLAGKTATLEKMRSGELYIIVGQSVQFLIFEKKESQLFVFRGDYRIGKEEIKEVWKITGHYSAHIPAQGLSQTLPSWDQRFEELEKRVYLLEKEKN